MSKQPLEFWTAVERIRAGDGRYARDAYGFVMESLDVTVRGLGERRHVSAHELLRGICEHARGRYGLLAWTLLDRWGIREAGDVGEIVFQLVEAGILARRDEDARSDFDVAIDFRRLLEELYLVPNPEA